jgi:sugar/nucleoside kinase (ribokinase family)
MTDGPAGVGVVVGNPVVDEVRRDGMFLRQACGGTATYAALALRALGLRTVLVGATGDDFPDMLRVPLAAAGVDISHVRILPGSSTAYRLDYAGDPPVRTVRRRSPGPVLDAQGVPCRPADAAFVHVGPVAGEVLPEAILELATWGVPLAIDLHALRRFAPDGRVHMGSAADCGIDFSRFETVKGSVEEILAFAPGTTDVVEGMRGVARLGVRTVFATNGDDGALVWADGEVTRVPAYPVVEVDATGAGDVFLAGYLFAHHVLGESAVRAAWFGAAAASFVVEGPGTTVLGSPSTVRERRAHLDCLAETSAKPSFAPQNR